jgi:hypothetical protein
MAEDANMTSQDARSCADRANAIAGIYVCEKTSKWLKEKMLVLVDIKVVYRL